MAGPITHIVLTEKIFNKEFGNLNKKDFIVGTSFPDIRYLGTISREKSHLEILPIDKIVLLESFDAGMHFHSLVDKIREDFLVTRNIYSYCPESKYITQAVKSIEEKVLYNKIDNWAVYQSYFDNLLPQEINTDAGETTITKWHNILKAYFSQTPNEKTNEDFVKENNLAESVAIEINKIVKEIENKPQITSYITDLYSNFEELVKSFKN